MRGYRYGKEWERKLPRKFEEKMKLMDERIKIARLRRNMSNSQVVELDTCSSLIVNRIEKGSLYCVNGNLCSCFIRSATG